MQKLQAAELMFIALIWILILLLQPLYEESIVLRSTSEDSKQAKPMVSGTAGTSAQLCMGITLFSSFLFS